MISSAIVLVMGRPKREYDPHGIYHLTAHGIDDIPIYRDDNDRQDFCIRFRRVAHEERWEVHAGSLVDTHYHLLVRPTLGRVSAGMKLLNGGYSRAFNKRHDRHGALFESRYRDWTIRDDEHYAHTVDYIEQNAIAAGIVDCVEDWPWTTANAESPLRVSDIWSDLSAFSARSRRAGRPGVWADLVSDTIGVRHLFGVQAPFAATCVRALPSSFAR